jgi:hypothetical protein
VTVVSDQTTAPVTVVPTLTVSTIGTGSGTVVGISGTTAVTAEQPATRISRRARLSR